MRGVKEHGVALCLGTVSAPGGKGSPRRARGSSEEVDAVCLSPQS